MEEKLDPIKLFEKNQNYENGADDDDENDTNMEEEDEAELTNLAWLTELRNQSHKAWHNGLKNFEKTTKTTNLLLKEHHECNVYNEHDYDYTDTSFHKNNGENITTTTEGADQLKYNSKKTVAAASILPKTNNATKPITKSQFLQQHLENNQKRPDKRPTPMERFEIFCKKIKRDFEEYEKCSEHYQNEENEKPPFNYSHIIGMAMLEKGRVTLQQICTWIEYKFAYFRLRKKWNNSIRHNLSLHPCFRKIERKKYEKGKGGYWELGIDLKKCDRKRIRHRKSNSLQQSKQQNLPEPISTNINKNNNNNNNNNDNLFYEMHVADQEDEELEVAENVDVDNEIEITVEEEEDIALNKICMNLVTEVEEDLLIDDDDDLDVQQNVNISSSSSSSSSCIHYNDNNFFEKSHQRQQQEYQLGTIIISASATATTTSKQQDEQEHGNDDEDKPENMNVITSNNHSMLTDTNNLSCFIDMPHQSNTVQDFFTNQIPTENVNNLIMDDGNNEEQMQHTHRGPNVIVEEIQQQQHQHLSIINNYHVATLLSPLNNNNNRNINLTSNNNIDNNNNNNNMFHTAEIDSIEEAFQYLRSLDHYNREDTLLDHLFDVSVSDF